MEPTSSNSVRIRPNVPFRLLEPYGGNLYRPHNIITSSGEYWRCQHGKTGKEKRIVMYCMRCWIGYRLSLIVERFAIYRCAVCKNAGRNNIIEGQFVCDDCFNTMLREREYKKEMS